MGGGLTPLQRRSQCILQPQLTGQISVVLKPQNLYTRIEKKQIMRVLGDKTESHRTI